MVHVRGGLRGRHPDVVRAELKIPPEDFPTNTLRIGRDPIEKHAVFLER